MVRNWLPKSWRRFFSPKQSSRKPSAHYRPYLEALEDRLVLSNIFTVTSASDSLSATAGDGTLRGEILALNQSTAPGTNVIDFNIGTGGVQTISLVGSLPTITNAVTIDGSSQPGFAGTPLIVLNGSGAGSGANGLTLEAGNSTVEDLAIDNFVGVVGGEGGAGIELETVGDDVLTGNYIGVDSTGKTAAANSYGVFIFGSTNNTVGGTTTGTDNVISANIGNGVTINDSGYTDNATGNVVEGNYIGTDVTGTKALGNGTGVDIDGSYNTVGGTTAAARNIISANAGGVAIGAGTISSGHNMVEGNYIGTDVTGAKPLGNTIEGMDIESSNNTVGGTTAQAGNVIADNTTYGMYIADGTAAGNVVEGNFIGTDAAGDATVTNLGNGTGVYIYYAATNNTIGGTATGAGNIISANVNYGVQITGASYSGSAGNVIEGNYIGTDKDGTAALANGYGVGIYGSAGNTVGGTATGDLNVISANTNDGVYIYEDSTTGVAPGNVVEGNYIGTDVTGTAALANGNGVVIDDGAANNTVGGTVSAALNVISANMNYGVYITASGATGNVVEGNYIGTDESGTKALGNGTGVLIESANNTVGGTVSRALNVISGNIYGMEIAYSGATGNMVQGNYIGTDKNGTAALANTVGLDIYESANNTIGGTVAAARNVISANTEQGVFIGYSGATGNVVEGNYIGTDYTGTAYNLGNAYGVYIGDGAGNNTVGGTTTAARNVLSANTYGVYITDSGTTGNMVQGNYIGTDATGTKALGNGTGVLVDTGIGNAIRQNSIYDSSNLGIELVNNGNNNQAAPTLTSATTTGSSITINGMLSAADSTAYTLDFFASPVANPSGYGEGQLYLGSATVTTNASGTVSFSGPTTTFSASVPAGWVVSATATDPNGNTSAFATDVTVAS